MNQTYILKDGPCKGRKVNVQLIKSSHGWIPPNHIKVVERKTHTDFKIGDKPCKLEAKIFIYLRQVFKQGDSTQFEFVYKED